MRATVMRALAGMLVLLSLTVPHAYAQLDADEPLLVTSSAAYSQRELDQLLAPIALYPDSLLTQILMAATYPSEIVEAERWLQYSDNAALQGEQLADALEDEPWDPSVKSLVPFPQILRMMERNLNWTEQLGDAFLADQPAVMDAVQRLRRKAHAAGNLRSTPYGIVSEQDDLFEIEPTDSRIVYVPVYDPFLVYGAWPYYGYPPYYFPDSFSATIYGGTGLGWFSFGINLPLWGWSDWDWRRHRIFLDRHRFDAINRHHHPGASDTWRHDPAHRRGVPYRDAATRKHFLGERTPDAQRIFRGYPATGMQAVPPLIRAPQTPVTGAMPQVVKPLMRERQQAPGAAMPQVVKPSGQERREDLRAAPAFESFGRGNEIRSQSERGQASRREMQGRREEGGEGRRQAEPSSGDRHGEERESGFRMKQRRGRD